MVNAKIHTDKRFYGKIEKITVGIIKQLKRLAELKRDGPFIHDKGQLIPILEDEEGAGLFSQQD
jgi:hypothetical protein